MELFSLRHLCWLAATALGVWGCARMRLVPLSSRWHRILRTSLFLVVLVNEAAWSVYRHVVAGVPLAQNLPLHLCDLSVFIMLITLASGRPLLVAMAYYAGVAGALLAVCMPAISESGAIAVIAEIRYFITHIAIVSVGFYFTYGRRHYPSAKALLKCYVAIHVYALLITPVNLYLGTNYFFTLSAPPQLAFILRYPHWLFCLVVSLVFLGVFSILHLPLAWLRRRETSVSGP
jgi:hypothetical integral membrane protein (TIGR02206 family)